MTSEDMLQLLPESILDPKAENNIKLWELSTYEMDNVETVFNSFRSLRSVEDCSDIHLDNLGALVQEARLGVGDKDYRKKIRTAPKVQLSNGSLPDIIEIAQTICEDYFLTVRELHPGNEDASWADDNIRWLDGSLWLDGSFFLCGDELEPAFFEVRIKSTTPDDIKASLDLALSRCRAGGIKYRIREVEVDGI